VTDVLRVEDLAVHYLTPNGPIKAVDGVSFALKPGERLGLKVSSHVFPERSKIGAESSE